MFTHIQIPSEPCHVRVFSLRQPSGEAVEMKGTAWSGEPDGYEAQRLGFFSDKGIERRQGSRNGVLEYWSAGVLG